MIEVNVDNLSSTKGSKSYVLPPPCLVGVPQVAKVHTYYSLYPRYSVWDPRIDDWWRDRRSARRAWSTAAAAQTAIDVAKEKKCLGQPAELVIFLDLKGS